MPEKLLSVDAVLEILCISRNTLNRYRREGKIKAVSFSSRAIRFRPADVEEFITARSSDALAPQEA